MTTFITKNHENMTIKITIKHGTKGNNFSTVYSTACAKTNQIFFLRVLMIMHPSPPVQLNKSHRAKSLFSEGPCQVKGKSP